MEKHVASTFKERPKNKITWWAMILGLSLLVIFIALAAGVLPKNWSWGPLNVMPALLLAFCLAAWITGIIAYRKGERSYVLWIGLIPAILFALILVAEFTIME